MFRTTQQLSFERFFWWSISRVHCWHFSFTSNHSILFFYLQSRVSLISIQCVRQSSNSHSIVRFFLYVFCNHLFTLTFELAFAINDTWQSISQYSWCVVLNISISIWLDDVMTGIFCLYYSFDCCCCFQRIPIDSLQNCITRAYRNDLFEAAHRMSENWQGENMTVMTVGRLSITMLIISEPCIEFTAIFECDCGCASIGCMLPE